MLMHMRAQDSGNIFFNTLSFVNHSQSCRNDELKDSNKSDVIIYKSNGTL